MSAYICHNDTFDLIGSALRFLSSRRVEFQPHDRERLIAAGVIASDCDSFHIRTEETTVGKILMFENVRSVCYRYKETNEYSNFLDYRFRPVNVERVDLVAVLMSIHCLRYQSCEADDYADTTAGKLLDVIEAGIVRALPGYSESAWGWTRESSEPLPSEKRRQEALKALNLAPKMSRTDATTRH